MKVLRFTTNSKSLRIPNNYNGEASQRYLSLIVGRHGILLVVPNRYASIVKEELPTVNLSMVGVSPKGETGNRRHIPGLETHSIEDYHYTITISRCRSYQFLLTQRITYLYLPSPYN